MVGKQLSAPLSLGIQGSLIARAITSKKIASPLSTRFFSMVPYQLGSGDDRKAMKYSAKPCFAGDNTPTAAQLQDPNYLRAAMKKHLATKSSCFEFLVQSRTQAQTNLDIEHSTQEWSETDAPFVKVATITIPPQNFDKPAQHKFCENLSYSPWHAVPEHRPLGGVNRIRKVVYTAISSLRRGMNSVTPKEPDGSETF